MTLAEVQHRLRLAHQARRAKEHQLDDIRRAMCDAGWINDDDPYGHADLADVIRQAAAGDYEHEAAPLCGHPGPAADDPSNPCTLPLGHELHRDQDGCSWPTPVRVKPKPACPDLPGHETHSPPCGFFQRPEAAALTRPAPAPCSINHNCPGRPRPVPLTARHEARCQSQHRRDGEPLVQCARAVHSDDAHTDYDTDKPGRKPGGVPWFVWGADSEAGELAEVAPDPMAMQDRIEAALRETRDRWMPDGDPVYIAALVSDALTAIRRG